MEISMRGILNYVEFRTILHPTWCRAVTLLSILRGAGGDVKKWLGDGSETLTNCYGWISVK